MLEPSMLAKVTPLIKLLDVHFNVILTANILFFANAPKLTILAKALTQTGDFNALFHVFLNPKTFFPPNVPRPITLARTPASSLPLIELLISPDIFMTLRIFFLANTSKLTMSAKVIPATGFLDVFPNIFLILNIFFPANALELTMLAKSLF